MLVAVVVAAVEQLVVPFFLFPSRPTFYRAPLAFALVSSRVLA